MVFEDIVVHSLSIIGITLIILAFLEYRRTKNEVTRFGLLGMGLGLFGCSFIVHYIMVDYTDAKYLFTGGLSTVLAVLCGFKGIYELGTGKPRTYLTANQEIHIVGSVVLKYYNWVECYYFGATLGDNESNNLHVIPITYAIPTEKFSKVPNRNSTFETGKNRKIKQDTIDGKIKQDIMK